MGKKRKPKPPPDKPVIITLAIGPRFLSSLRSMLVITRICGDDSPSDSVHVLAAAVVQAIENGDGTLSVEWKEAPADGKD